MTMKEKTTKQVLISIPVAQRLHIAAVKAGKTMREFLDEMILNHLVEDDIGEPPAAKTEIVHPEPLTDDDIGSVSVKISLPVQAPAIQDRTEREF